MKKWFVLLFVATLVFGACSDEETTVVDGLPSVLGPNDKADNFRSESAQEYFVRGTTTITLEEEYRTATEEERLQQVRDLIPYKHVVIGWFLNAYLIDKARDADNADYGGFHGLTKNGSYEDLDIQLVEDLTYSFTFIHEIGGQLDLLRELSEKAHAKILEDGSYLLRVAVGEVPNSEMIQLDHDREWYRKSPWSTFNPESIDESVYYYQDLEVLPQERSHDAWIDYERLYEDGKLRVGIFFGWDYHAEYHRKHSRTTYNWLVRNGFQSPTASYDEYANNRGPLTRSIRANGKNVDVEITLWWGEPGTDTDPDTDAGGRTLEEAMVESFRVNEATVFSGHSGPWYGFALANWRTTAEGDLDDSKIPHLEMPADKYQIVLAEGCDTYALGQAFWMNPSKADRKNLDIITTTSFSSASNSNIVTQFLNALVGTNNAGDHVPVRYGKLLQDLDRSVFFFKTMYGVHGLDNNPQGHPYANHGALCSSCSSDGECGGVGNRCVNLEGTGVCTYECTTDAGCADGFSCRETAVSGWLSEKVCVPTSFTCDDIPAPSGPTVIINEVLADPPQGLAGDLNGDGVRHHFDDEFIELKNVGAQAVDMSGWTLSDSIMVRFTFPHGAVIEPGGYVVVFGGGDVEEFTGLPDVPVYAAQRLSLANAGDSVFLADRDHKVVDQMSYGTEGGRAQSLVRVSPEGDQFTRANTPTPGAPN
ncbi:MAG: lamin tail domain-containing protein [Bradymonadaceae bacterium]